MEQAQDIRKLVGPEDGADTVSYGGETFEADKDGIFAVPAAAVPELLPHGFKPAQTAKQAAKNGSK